jgi:hypothetical protein
MQQAAAADDSDEGSYGSRSAGDDDDNAGSSDDEAFNQRNFGIFQALPVEGEPDWSLGGSPCHAAADTMRVRRVCALTRASSITANDGGVSLPALCAHHARAAAVLCRAVCRRARLGGGVPAAGAV